MKKEQSSNSTQKVKYALAEKYDQENKEKNQKEVDAYERLKTKESEDDLAKELDNIIYIYEPDENEILEDLLPKNVSIQIFKTLLESNAGEQGARMIAMDNATRNAGEMIDSLSLKFNRTRQAYITKELIEVISGAEAV